MTILKCRGGHLPKHRRTPASIIGGWVSVVGCTKPLAGHARSASSMIGPFANCAAYRCCHLRAGRYTDACNVPLCKCACVRRALRPRARTYLSPPQPNGCAPNPHFLARAATTQASVTKRGLCTCRWRYKYLRYSLLSRGKFELRSRPSAVPEKEGSIQQHERHQRSRWRRGLSPQLAVS